MSYRDIPKERILKFPATPAFKGWTDYFTNESIAHPAKMNLNLLRHILQTYTRPGDTVLDPMAGTGSTIILASLLGRHGIAVEYESRFCEMIRGNIKLSAKQTTLTLKGRMTCIQGDARELSKLLEEPDAIITSPPYSECIQFQDEEFSQKARPGRSYHTGILPSENNIGNLPHGDIEAIVTSPPYEASISKKNMEMERLLRLYRSGELKGETKRKVEDWLRNPDKNLGYVTMQEVSYTKNIDAVVSSPPYGNRLADDVVHDGDEARMSYRQAMDSIVTSPPYEGSETETGGDKGKRGGDSRLRIKKDYIEVSNENIGNLKSESYLVAMLQVYRECYKVLKPKGIMILVTKNFIRDKQVVRLDEDTIKLCKASGFTLKDRWYFKLPQKSFWRIIYKKNYPDVPEVEYEDVLIFVKNIDHHSTNPLNVNM